MKNTISTAEKLEVIATAIAAIYQQKAFDNYVHNNKKYQELTEAACTAEQACMALDLPPEQTKTIDIMKDKMLDAHTCETTLTYMAGVIDALYFVISHGFLDEYIEGIQKI